MENCESVEKEVDKVIKKFTDIKEHSQSTINDIIDTVNLAKSSIDNGLMTELSKEKICELKNAIKKSKDKLHQIATDHRNLHGTVSKVGKAIDKNFAPDYQAIAPLDMFKSEEDIRVLNQVIIEHFYRQGMNDVAETLTKESRLPPEEDIHLELFADIYAMWEAILNRNLGPAIEWVNQYTPELDSRYSSLEFKLHRLAFLQILEKGLQTQAEAITYARIHFKKFIDRFEKDIQTLMGTLIYLPNGIQNSPYSHLFSQDMWTEAADAFLNESCEIIGINKDSALEIIVNAGCIALPALSNLKQIMLRNQVSGIWSGRNELPVSVWVNGTGENELPIEIELGQEYRYHSIFTCPILKQPSNDNNPPMRLVCGHAISKDAMNKLVRGLILKCPYCPKENNVADAKRLYF